MTQLQTTTSTTSRKSLWIGLISIAVLAAVVIGWKARPVKRPPLDTDPIALAKFTASNDFDRLSEPQKRPYRAIMRAKSKELAEALAAGKLSREEYDQAYLNGWVARQTEHMRKYFRLPVAGRAQAWADTYEKTAAVNKAAPTALPVPDKKVEDAFMDKLLASWTADDRAQWEEFRAAAKAAKSKRAGK